MKAWAVVAHGAPLECVEIADLVPTGAEIVVTVTHCGVCHSDLHLWHGGYDLGGGKFLSVADRGLKLPAAPGHEIVGRVTRIGPDATGVAIGDVRVVYPWIGCGTCGRCATGDDNLCLAQRSLGAVVNGGFAREVMVPHGRYLLPFDGVPAALAATYACSGITAYAAARKILPLPADAPVVVIGAGGVGLAAMATLKALGHRNIVSVDRDAGKAAVARAAGAAQFIDGDGDDVGARILAACGPVAAVLDFVGASATVATAMAVLTKAGKLVLVGVGGGELTLSVAGTIFRAQTIQGSLTGSIQDLREVLALARDGVLAPTPVTEMAKDRVNEAMTRLERGGVAGRMVLVDAG